MAGGDEAARAGAPGSTDSSATSMVPIMRNPQPAKWNMQRRFVRSELEPRGPRNGLEIGP
eukprot:8456728-Alexandrium_andersonii.AAC.1